MPNMPATTPNMATTNVAVVSINSNCISWLRTLSCSSNIHYSASKTTKGGTSDPLSYEWVDLGCVLSLTDQTDE